MTKSTDVFWVYQAALRGGFTIWTSKWDKVVGCIDDEARYGAIESEQDAKLIAAAPEMLEALEAIVELAAEAYQHWDADREMKVGKILLALSGNLSGYHPRIDAVHQIIAKAKGAQP